MLQFNNGCLARRSARKGGRQHTPQLRRRIAIDLTSRLPHLLKAVAQAVLQAWRLPTALVFSLVLVLSIVNASASALLALLLTTLYVALPIHELGHICASRLLGWQRCYLAVGPGIISVVRLQEEETKEVLVGRGGAAAALVPGLLILALPLDLPLRLALSLPFLAQCITVLPPFNDSPWHRRVWLSGLALVKKRVKGKWGQLGNTHMKGRHLFALGWRALVSFVSTGLLSTIVFILTAVLLALLADLAGWPPFHVELFGIHVLSYVKEVGFGVEFGEGLYMLGALAGLVSSLIAAYRFLRQRKFSG